MSARIIQGDARSLPLRSESIDAICTDPPYGIGFMGREWDSFKPGKGEARIVPNRKSESTNPNLKGRTRGPASSPSAVEYDRSAAGQLGFQHWTQDWATEALRVLKPGAHMLVCGAPRSYHRMACGIEDAGFEIRETFAWLFGQGFPKSLNVGRAIDSSLCELPGKHNWTEPRDGNGHRCPETPEGDAHRGKGTGLKPSFEPVVLARKPLRGTVAANVARWGTGALNIEAGRVGTSKAIPASPRRVAQGPSYGDLSNDPGTGSGWDSNIGRWPPNLLLTHSPDCAAACVPWCPVRVLDEQSGELVHSAGVARSAGDGSHNGIRSDVTGFLGCPAPRFGDTGTASRFFPTFRYCPKADRAERELGLYHLPKRTGGELTDRENGTAGLQSPRAGAGRNGGRANHHPTVKPVALIRWLIQLITPPGGTVLDCFVGSGTAGVAAVDLGFDFIGIEREAEYVEIGRARIVGSAPLFAELTA